MPAAAEHTLQSAGAVQKPMMEWTVQGQVAAGHRALALAGSGCASKQPQAELLHHQPWLLTTRVSTAFHRSPVWHRALNGMGPP